MSDKKKNKVDAGSPFAALKEMRDRLEKEAKEKAAAKSAPAAKKPGTKAQAPARATASSPRGPVHPEDVQSFQHYMTGVAPLSPATHGRAGHEPAPKREGAKEIAARARAEAEEARDRLAALATGGHRFEMTDDGRHLEGRRDDTPPELLRKLRRGMFPIDAKLDLHGKTAEEAERELFAFLQKTRANKERVVLVVHGKGEHSPGGAGVLRGEIGAWLSQGRSARFVAAFATARDDEGGAGAMYVALAR